MVRSAAENARIKSEWTKSWILFFSFLTLSHSLSLSRPFLNPPLHCVVQQLVIRLHREESGQKWRLWFVTVGACADQRADRAPPEQTLFRNFFSLSNKFLSLFITRVTKAQKKPQRICYQRGDKSTKAEKDELWEIVMTVEIFFGWTSTRGNRFRKKVCNSFVPLQLKRSFLIQ